jgi:hypothetical protein
VLEHRFILIALEKALPDVIEMQHLDARRTRDFARVERERERPAWDSEFVVDRRVRRPGLLAVRFIRGDPIARDQAPPAWVFLAVIAFGSLVGGVPLSFPYFRVSDRLRVRSGYRRRNYHGGCMVSHHTTCTSQG